jgi:hypothetical protein
MKLSCLFGIHSFFEWEIYRTPNNHVLGFRECRYCGHSQAQAIRGKYSDYIKEGCNGSGLNDK